MTAPGALLIGDAAGFLDPFTGEGIYAGLQSAHLAADAILPCLRAGSMPESGLDAYGLAWQQELLPKWRLATWLQQAIRYPFLAEWLVTYLRRRPAAAAWLLAAAGDQIPAGDLRLSRLLHRLIPSRSAA
jgi:flavin-dependent dehydrogenase